MSRVIAAVFIASAIIAPVRADVPRVTVTASQLVHPVLIRNPRNGLLRVVVNVKKQSDLKLTSLSFELRGTDDLTDVASLQVFSTGKRQSFVNRSSAPGTAVSREVPPLRRLKIATNVPLQRGANVFWLSCRLSSKANLLHRVGAICTSVTTSQGRVEVRKNPNLGHRIGVALRRHYEDKVHTSRIPVIATTKRGTLLSAYDLRRRKGRDLQEDIDIGLSRSTDGGQTWEPVRVIMDMKTYGGLPQAQNGCSDPGLIVDRNTGEIFCFAVWMNGKPGKHQWSGDGSEPGFKIGKTAQFLMVKSKDDGKTWSKPENLTRKLKKKAWWLFAPSPQQGITLPDGTLVMPSQGRNEKGREFSTIMVSTNHGKTWRVGTPAYLGGSECQAVLLQNGSIMLNMRNEGPGRYRAVFTTNDFGKTWQAHSSHAKALRSPNCNGSLLRVDYQQDGKTKRVLLFVNPNTQKGRTHHTIKVSFDEGKTWPKSHHHLIDEGLGAGYPSLTRIDARHIGIVYEGSQSHVMFEKFTIESLVRPRR